MSQPRLAPIEPWINRLNKFASKLSRSKATDLQTDLEEFKSDFEEIIDLIEEITGSLEEWADDDSDRETRAEARERADQDINALESLLITLREKLGTPSS